MAVRVLSISMLIIYMILVSFLYPETLWKRGLIFIGYLLVFNELILATLKLLFFGGIAFIHFCITISLCQSRLRKKHKANNINRRKPNDIPSSDPIVEENQAEYDENRISETSKKTFFKEQGKRILSEILASVRRNYTEKSRQETELGNSGQ